MWDCIIPKTTPTFLDIANCVFVIAFGNVAFAALVGIAIFGWMAWKFHIPMHLTLPLGLGLVATLSVLYGEIEWLYWSGILLVFMLFALGLLKKFKVL